MRIVKYETENCAHCKALQPKLKAQAETNDLEVEKKMVSDNLEEARIRKVRSAPTVLFFNEEDEEVRRFSGDKTEDELENIFNDVLG